jgi:hypothetical protein
VVSGWSKASKAADKNVGDTADWKVCATPPNTCSSCGGEEAIVNLSQLHHVAIGYLKIITFNE